jgi:hypothetical protein
LGYLLKGQPYFIGAQIIEHYRLTVENRDYVLRLLDGSLIQMAYRIEHDEIIWHRLCWFPCPFALSSEHLEFAEGDVLSLFELFGLSDVQMVSPIRFEYDAVQSDELHPQSHITVNRETCRVPAYGPISAGHFLKFVLFNFHQGVFANLNNLNELKSVIFTRTLSRPIRHEIFVETPISESYR